MKRDRETGGIEYSFERPIDARSVQRLFKQTGWARERSLEGIGWMLENTPLKLGAWRGEELAGFARALSDGAYKAMIDDVVVDEGLRGKGIGTEMIRRIVDELKNVEVVFLPTGENLAPFYERLGFERMKTVFLHVKRGG